MIALSPLTVEDGVGDGTTLSRRWQLRSRFGHAVHRTLPSTRPAMFRGRARLRVL